MLLCTGSPYSSLSVLSPYSHVPPIWLALSNTEKEKSSGRYRLRCRAQQSPAAPAPITATFANIEPTRGYQIDVYSYTPSVKNREPTRERMVYAVGPQVRVINLAYYRVCTDLPATSSIYKSTCASLTVHRPREKRVIVPYCRDVVWLV